MWFIIGAIAGALLIGFIVFLKSKNFMLNWYEWLLGMLGFLLLLFTIQNAVGSLIELEPTAAWMFLLILGLPSLVFLALAWQLAARRYKSS